jgi:serine/threonine protein phosphatase PrpC
MADPSQLDTVDDFHPISPPVAERPHPDSAGVVVDVGAVTDVGRRRPNNEDHYLVVRFGRVMETLRTNLADGQVPIEFGEVGYGLVVADGMGGAAAGEVASSLAIITGLNLALNHPHWTVVMTQQEIEENMARWRHRFRQIDAILTERARKNPELKGMGTTLTIAFTLGPHLILYHVGDSRAYLFRRGRLHGLTRDHTYAQALADAGRIPPEEVPRHRLRHVLTRVLGKSGGDVEVDIEYLRLEDGDRLLLCTDGLTEMVTDDEIAEILGQTPLCDPACRALADRALAAGGVDNITVVLGNYSIPKGPFPQAPPAGIP